MKTGALASNPARVARAPSPAAFDVDFAFRSPMARSPDDPMQLRMRHLLRLDELIKFLARKMPQLHRRLAQAAVLDVRRVRNLRRLVVFHLLWARGDRHQAIL